MATAPTRAYAATPTAGWASTATPKTSPAFDVQTGDLIVLLAFSEDAFHKLGAPTWTGAGAWTLRQSVEVSNYCTAYLYTCAVTATATGRTISMARTSGSGQFSFYVSGWRNHGGIGVSGKANVASGAPALNLTTSANSAVVVGNSDWTANGSSWSWRTVNGSPLVETSRGGTAGTTYMCYSGYSPDTGAAGAKTFGMLTPATQKYSIVGIEILGTTTAPAYSWTLNLTGAGALTGTTRPAFTWATAANGAGQLAASMVPAFGWAAGFDGAGLLESAAIPAFDWDAQHDGAGTLTADMAPRFTWTATLDGVGSLTAETTTGRAWTAPLSGDGTLTATMAPMFAWEAEATGGGQLTANLTPAYMWDANYTGAGTLTATMVKGSGWYHILTGTGTLTSILRPHFTWDAPFTGAGTLADQPQEPNMAQPSPDWNLVLLRWAGVYLDGTPCTGRIKVAYNGTGEPMLDDDPETPLSIYAVELSVPLATKTVLFNGAPREVGYAELWVPATDDPDITGAGGTYKITELLDKSAGRPPFNLAVPIDTPAEGLWLNKATPTT